MQKYKFKTYRIADIGDYLKVFACTAVMSQPIMVLIMKSGQNANTQNIFGVFYNLVKYTAPAFIFGILYTTIRTNDEKGSFSYAKHMRANWSNLFVPTIWWTFIYLLGMPWVQQVEKYHNLGSFCWQFINGNAAPHLWYNTMMLQFIILMPLFWAISRYVKDKPKQGLAVAIATLALYLLWLGFYDANVFHGPHEQDWYLLDRVFISFFIYGVFGILSWQFRDYYNQLMMKYWWLLLIAFLGCFVWTNIELFGYGHPVDFGNAPYYKPSMTFYSLLVIFLVSAICLHQVKKNSETSLKVFHFLSVYAYRAYLANVFWDQLVWRGLNMAYHAAYHPLLTFFGTWIFTWILSFTSAYILNISWTWEKSKRGFHY